MPVAYRNNQKALLDKIKEQYDGPPLKGPLRVEMELHGEGRGDIDNVAGALMDTANGVLWVDDRVTIIPELLLRWEKAPKVLSKWIIRITPLDEGQVELDV